jgi:hypothetical protein
MPNIRLMLDLSTAHLPEDVCDNLDGYENVTAHHCTYGWLLWVPDDPDESCSAMRVPVPDVVLTIQRYARAAGCDYVLFDRDGDIDDQLPTWDW